MSSENKKLLVLICLDHSEKSQYVFDWCLNNFIDPEKHIVRIITVVTSLPTAGYYFAISDEFSPEYLDQLEKKIKNEISVRLKELFSRLMDKFGKKLECEMVIGTGEVRDEIVDYSSKSDVDLVILGTKEKGLLKRTFLGSTSDYCLHNCSCSVMIVKKKENSINDKK